MAFSMKSLSPQAQQALISGGIGALGAGLSAAGQGKEAEKQRLYGAQQATLGRAPGEEPGAYANLALKRALFEGIAPDATSMSLGGQFSVPAEMQQFVPNMGPGLNLGPAREAILSRLSEQALNEDMARRRAVEQQALGMATGAGPEKKKSGFWGKLGKGLLKYAAPIAIGAIPGIGPAAAMGLRAAAGAAGGAMGGGGLKGAVTGAAGGALAGKVPGKLGSVIEKAQGAIGGAQGVFGQGGKGPAMSLQDIEGGTAGISGPVTPWTQQAIPPGSAEVEAMKRIISGGGDPSMRIAQGPPVPSMTTEEHLANMQAGDPTSRMQFPGPPTPVLPSRPGVDPRLRNYGLYGDRGFI